MKNIAKLTSYGCYLDCDFVTAKYPGDETHIVGNVAEYVYDLEQKISDLEAKLAEKDAQIKRRVAIYEKNFIEQTDEIYKLKQQLAEKETRIAELEDKDWYEETIKQLEEQNGRLIEKRDQDKISFCIEKLEKVKKYIHGKYLDETWHNKIVDEDREDTHEYIDNQIEQLKEGK